MRFFDSWLCCGSIKRIVVTSFNEVMKLEKPWKCIEKMKKWRRRGLSSVASTDTRILISIVYGKFSSLSQKENVWEWRRRMSLNFFMLVMHISSYLKSIRKCSKSKNEKFPKSSNDQSCAQSVLNLLSKSFWIY